MLTGFALGLQQALGKEQEQPAIIMQTSGDPPMDLPVEAEVEQGRPRQSVVSVRPWLLPDRREQGGASTDTPTDAGTTTDAVTAGTSDVGTGAITDADPGAAGAGDPADPGTTTRDA
jgi:hypothetical protein